MDEDDKLRKLAIESPRLHGLYTTTLGLLILGVFTFFPLLQSLKGGRFVSWYSGVATIWGVVCVIFGLTAIIGGKKAFKLKSENLFSLYSVLTFATEYNFVSQSIRLNEFAFLTNTYGLLQYLTFADVTCHG